MESLREHIRQRPGMYVGGLNPTGWLNLVHFLVEELLDHASSPLTSVSVELRDGAISLTALGDTPLPPLDELLANDELRLTPFVWSLQCINALCSSWSIQHARATGEHQSWTSAEGVLAKAASSGCGDSPRLHVEFTPDPTLFSLAQRATYHALCGQAIEWATFHPHTRFSIADIARRLRRGYQFERGLLSLAEEIEFRWCRNSGRSDFGWAATWSGELTDAGESASAVIVPLPMQTRNVISFANRRRTSGGGSHVHGILSGIREARARDTSRWRSGCTILVAVRLHDPAYKFSTCDVLMGDRPFQLCKRLIREQYRVESKA